MRTKSIIVPRVLDVRCTVDRLWIARGNVRSLRRYSERLNDWEKRCSRASSRVAVHVISIMFVLLIIFKTYTSGRYGTVRGVSRRRIRQTYSRATAKTHAPNDGNKLVSAPTMSVRTQRLCPTGGPWMEKRDDCINVIDRPRTRRATRQQSGSPVTIAQAKRRPPVDEHYHPYLSRARLDLSRRRISRPLRHDLHDARDLSAERNRTFFPKKKRERK